MTKKNSYPGGVKLTATKARAVAMQEFGTTKGLTKEETAMPGYLARRAGRTRRFCGRISFSTGTNWTKSGALARRAAWFPAKRSGKSSSERVNSSRHTRNERCADSI